MKLVKPISLVLALLAVGLLVARYGRSFTLGLQPSPKAPVPALEAPSNDVGPVVRLDPFVVSEGDSDRHMATVTFEVEVSDNRARDAVKSHTSAIRSAILTVLADTKLNDIGDPEDLNRLKERVQGRVQSILPARLVRRVLITEFLSL